MSRLVRVAAGLLAIPLAFTFYGVGRIEGNSMQPALNPDGNGGTRDWVLLERYPGRLQRGDIVFLRAPHNPDLVLVKRIQALPGDAILPRAQERYAHPVYHPPPAASTAEAGPDTPPSTCPHPRAHGMGSQTREPRPLAIPPGHCWVESDEGFRGLDSNAFGPVPLGLVRYRVRSVLYPRWVPRLPDRPLAEGRLSAQQLPSSFRRPEPALPAGLELE